MLDPLKCYEDICLELEGAAVVLGYIPEAYSAVGMLGESYYVEGENLFYSSNLSGVSITLRMRATRNGILERIKQLRKDCRVAASRRVSKCRRARVSFRKQPYSAVVAQTFIDAEEIENFNEYVNCHK